jgi:cell wall-associated NlpC family hydrolase
VTIALRVAWLVFPKRVTAVLALVAAVLLVVLLVLMAADAQRRRPFLPFPFPSIDAVTIARIGGIPATVDIPLEQTAAIIGAAERSSCGVPWNLLAAVARQESNFGKNAGMFTPHDGGILGYGQFAPATWARYGNGGNIYAYQDALPAMAAYLCDLGVTSDAWLALMRYSGCDPRQPSCHRTDGYADTVLARALVYGSASSVPALSQEALTLEKLGAQWLNFPYRLGGNGLSPQDGIDCSALVQKLFAAIGIPLPRTAQQQYDAVQKFSPRDAQPGDLLFFTNTYDAGTYITHVGIYEGIVDGAPRMLDASGTAVRYDNPFAGYWKAHLVAAGRP